MFEADSEVDHHVAVLHRNSRFRIGPVIHSFLFKTGLEGSRPTRSFRHLSPEITRF
ncbi:hypothetical protein [Bradyrhizobium sp. MOS002]|uniref:hypothetical protein n=1 Tax=Bradyrhizobium sp. MOS002 TaxID=2133947 RepID=UPI001FE0E044|nr:hypothetical protein [Bradyrhizobium sp. MOS002]